MSDLNLFVPGRLCLFGEHSDWAGGYRRIDPGVEPGYCLAVGTTQGIRAQITRDGTMLQVDSHVLSDRVGSLMATMMPSSLENAARGGGFYAYCAGVAAHISEHYCVGGITITTKEMDLPIKKGLSSSAAICVLTARAFNSIYDLGLSIREEMECAYLGEIRTGSQCGRMDQVCAYGQTPVFLKFDGDQMGVQTLHPRKPLHLVIVDLNRSKDTRRILHDLNTAFVSETIAGNNIRHALGSLNTQILSRARIAINDGDAQTIGSLMTEAQTIFDAHIAPACPSELSAPKLHAVLNHPLIRELSWGGKGVGSQGDGCAQLIARDRESQQQLMEQLPAILDVECLELTITANGDQG